MILLKFYYRCKNIIPRFLQIEIRRKIAYKKRLIHKNIWPINNMDQERPAGVVSWPEKKGFALILRHDVDTNKGYKNCHRLLEIEEKLGFRSSFNFVPERYHVSDNLRKFLIKNGFEVGIHGLKHDGKLFFSKKVFQNRAKKINMYLKKWNSVGFYAPSTIHNLEWIKEFNIEYDASTYDNDPFEPKNDSADTIFPFWVKGDSKQKGFIELPYTLPQDFTLFILLREKSIDVWEKKLDWIVNQNGMVFLNTHPDYMNFNEGRLKNEEYPVDYYIEFLNYIKAKYKGQYWHGLPKQLVHFWKKNFVSN